MNFLKSKIKLQRETSHDNISLVYFNKNEIEKDDIYLEDCLILKQVPILTNNKRIELTRFLCEGMISHNIISEYLNNSVSVSVESSNLNLLFDRALGSFKKYVKEIHVGNINTEQKLLWIWKAASCVKVLHSRRILHGDLKAANYLMFSEDDIKLADFGLSCFILDGNEQTFPPHIKMYTVTHRPLEVWKSNKWGFPADIFSLGCVFYEIFYNKLLFPAQKGKDNTQDKYVKHLECFYESRYESRCESNKSRYENTNIYKLIMRMTNKDPNLRPTIFDILSDPIFKTFYDYEHIDNEHNNVFNSKIPIRYNMENFEPKFLSQEMTEKIMDFTMNTRTNKKLCMIVFMLYEQLQENYCKLDIELLKYCTTICYQLMYHDTPRGITLTRTDISKIVKISNEINFNFIDLFILYGIV